jgi:L-arabinose transport system ATP-binding protein
VGAGRSELLKLIYGGAEKHRRRRLPCLATGGHRRPIDAIRSGIMLCTEDRKEGIVPIHSVQENINLSARRTMAWGGFCDQPEAGSDENARRRIRDMRVKTPSPQRQLIRNLSGGNQQKVILGRWLSEDIRVHAARRADPRHRRRGQARDLRHHVRSGQGGHRPW